MVVLASALVSGVARAQPSDEAQAHFDRGAALAAEQKFEEAAAEFKASYDLRPRKESLFAWAQVLRLAGDCPGAIELYRKFLRSPELTPTQSEAAQLGIDRCETAPAPKPAPPPLPPPAPAPPPAAVVVAPPPPPIIPAHRSRGAVAAGAALLGGSIIALGTSGTFYWLSRDAEKQALAAPTWGAYREPAARSRTQQRWALGFLGAGVLLAGGAVLEWLTTAPDQGTGATAWIGGGGAGVGLRGTY
jgi:hypothetical protein